MCSLSLFIKLYSNNNLLNNKDMIGFFNLEHCVFCHIISIGDDGHITINANGYEYITSMDQMILL